MRAVSRSTFARLVHDRRGVFVVAGLIVALAAVGGLQSDRFRTAENVLNVLEQSTALAIVSLGQTITILTGGIDLSVGSLISLSSVLLSGVTDNDPNMIVWALIMVLLVGIFVGLINATCVILTGVHPLIVTLGTGTILQGIVLLYTLGPAGGMPAEFSDFAYGRFFGLPVGAILAVGLFVAVGTFLRHVRMGRYIFAVGDDPLAAKMMGLPRAKVLLIAYAFSGVAASLAAIFLVARFGVGQPYTGQNYTLSSITPVVVGGTILSGGRGGVLGSLLGVYLISLLNNVLNFMDLSTHYQMIAQGLIVVIAVSAYVERARS